MPTMEVTLEQVDGQRQEHVGRHRPEEIARRLAGQAMVSHSRAEPFLAGLVLQPAHLAHPKAEVIPFDADEAGVVDIWVDLKDPRAADGIFRVNNQRPEEIPAAVFPVPPGFRSTMQPTAYDERMPATVHLVGPDNRAVQVGVPDLLRLEKVYERHQRDSFAMMGVGWLVAGPIILVGLILERAGDHGALDRLLFSKTGPMVPPMFWLGVSAWIYRRAGRRALMVQEMLYRLRR